MTRLFFTTSFFLLALAGKTQIVDHRVDNYTSRNFIDTFLVYSYHCSGCVISFDSCGFDEPHYLMWKKNGNYFLKRFDYCTTFKTLTLDIYNPLVFYLNNRTAIEEEEIKQPTYYEVKKRKRKVDTLITTSTMSHSYYHKFQLPFLKDTKFKYVDTYDLAFEKFEDGKRNFFYDYNQRTRLKALIDLTVLLIDELRNGNKFEPQ
jgi:hypothetical protein